MMKSVSVFLIFFHFIPVLSETDSQWFLPINIQNRTDLSELKLTSIGQFGLQRKERVGVRAHLHTGIDIMRPSKNYDHEKIYPACKGKVMSIRDDGPFAQIIIEHVVSQGVVWSVYEHITNITCHVGDSVSPDVSLASFFSREDLDHYGWQFDHFHFEILKKKPIIVAYNPALPQRRYTTYALVCYTYEQLLETYFDPTMFLRQHLKSSFNDK